MSLFADLKQWQYYNILKLANIALMQIDNHPFLKKYPAEMIY